MKLINNNMEKTTHWYNSKTVYFNIVSAILAIIALPDFISIIPVSAMPLIALLSSIGNWVLRVYFTSKPIE